MAGADHYDLWVNNLSTGQSQVIRNANVAGTSFAAATQLVPGEMYAWWVATVDSNGYEYWSAKGTFSEAGMYPSLVGPYGQISAPTPTFSWNGVALADHYDLWVDDTSLGQSQVIRQNVTGTSFTPSVTLAAGHNYRWWVAAVDSSGLEYWSGTGYFSEALLPAPTLLGPSGQTADTVNFTWSAVAAADHYDLWVRDLTTGVSPVLRNADVIGTSFTGAVPPGHQYQWWVATVDDLGHESWSTTGSFSTTSLAAPVVLAPSGLVGTQLPTFSWSAIATADHYDLWVNDLTARQAQVIRAAVVGTSFTPSSLLAAGDQYEWWVASVDSNGYESWSAAGFFVAA